MKNIFSQMYQIVELLMFERRQKMHEITHIQEHMDDDDSSDESDNDVSSPSPPFEGIVHEEPEKQNESQGRDFEKRGRENGEISEPYGKEVNMNT